MTWRKAQNSARLSAWLSTQRRGERRQKINLKVIKTLRSPRFSLLLRSRRALSAHNLCANKANSGLQDGNDGRPRRGALTCEAKLHHREGLKGILSRWLNVGVENEIKKVSKAEEKKNEAISWPAKTCSPLA
jgi:hypothetical protein